MLLDSLFRESRPAVSTRKPQNANRVRPLIEALEDRTLLAVRFVVPLDIGVNNTTTFHSLADALTTSGLANGDIIKIEAGSTPGVVNSSVLTNVNVNNLTIRGDISAASDELPVVGIASAQTIAEDDWVFENLDLFFYNSSSLTLNGDNIRLSNIDIISDSTATSLIDFNNATNSRLEDSTIVSFNGTGNLVNIGANSSGTVIEGNDFRSFSSSSQILVNFATDDPTGTQSAVISFNTFQGNTGTADLLNVSSINGLSIIDNDFFDSDSNQVAIDFETGNYRNVSVVGNDIELSGASGTIGIDLTGGGSGLTTSIVLRGNDIDTAGNGTAIRIAVAAGTFNVKGEANDFTTNRIGVEVTGTGSVNNIDFGGGNQGSLGGNNFSSFTTTATSNSGAIVTGVPSGNGTLNFQNNSFSVANPESVIFDNDDSNSVVNVTVANTLSGNAAFVSALYIEFLGRPGDLNNPNDAGGWVTALNNGTVTAFTAANSIIRSPESLTRIVENLYQTLLNRAADPAGLSSHVSRLQAGVTLEATIAAFATSSEYRNQFGSNFAWVQSLYRNLLEREPSTAEVDAWVNVMNQNGANSFQLVASAFVNSAEFRTLRIRDFYIDLLNRLPSDAEVSAWVNAGLDLLSIMIHFSASAEFQANA